MRFANIAFVLSALLLTEALVGIFRPTHSWLPRDLAFFVAIAVLLGWLVCIHLVFRAIGLSRRAHVAGWLFVAGVFCYAAARERTRFYLLGCWPSWPMQLEWALIGVLGLFAFFGLAVLVIRGGESAKASTPFTVESEHPDHVLYLPPARQSLPARKEYDA